MRSWGMRHVPASVLLLLAGGCARYQEAVPVPGPAPVALTQHRAAPFGEAVETEGFFVGFGQRLALAEEELAGSFSYAGREYRFQVGAEVPANPALRLDSDGDGDPSNDAPLPDSAYPSRSEGYLQALIEPVPGQPLRLVCVFKGGHFRALLCARSSWRGEAHVDGRTVGVVAFDRNANGDLSDDPVMLDVDGDGKIVPLEVVKPGEGIRLRARAWVPRADATGTSVALGLRDPAEGDRDILGEMERAPIAGRPCPAFSFTDSFTDAAGVVVSDETLRGRVVLLNFWADW